jgi:hypothetical protein
MNSSFVTESFEKEVLDSPNALSNYLFMNDLLCFLPHYFKPDQVTFKFIDFVDSSVYVENNFTCNIKLSDISDEDRQKLIPEILSFVESNINCSNAFVFSDELFIFPLLI